MGRSRIRARALRLGVAVVAASLLAVGVRGATTPAPTGQPPGRRPPPVASSPPPVPTLLAAVAVAGSSPFAGCRGQPGTARGTQVEPSVAVDPADPSHVVAAWQQDRVLTGGALGIVAAMSEDGGLTWQRSTPPLTACSGGPYPRVSDPVVSIGSGNPGVVYLSGIGIRPDRQTDVIVTTSSDGGRTWTSPTVVWTAEQANGTNDKEWVAADPRHRVIAGLVWVEFRSTSGRQESPGDVALFSRTEDGGRTWAPPTEVYGAGTETQYHQLALLPDGAVVDAFAELRRVPGRAPRERIATAHSVDGGRTWEPAVTAAAFDYSVAARPGQRIRADSQQFGLASTQTGGLALAWFEDPSAGSQRLLFARSDDEGRTWSAPVAIRDGFGPVFLPEVAAAGNGTLGVSWFEVEPGAGTGLPVDAWFASSVDGGRRWVRQHVAGPFDLDEAAPSPEGDFLGDYQGLAALPDGFAVLLSVSPPVARTGPAAVFFTSARPRAPILGLP